MFLGAAKISELISLIFEIRSFGLLYFSFLLVIFYYQIIIALQDLFLHYYSFRFGLLDTELDLSI